MRHAVSFGGEGEQRNVDGPARLEAFELSLRYNRERDQLEVQPMMTHGVFVTSVSI